MITDLPDRSAPNVVPVPLKDFAIVDAAGTGPTNTGSRILQEDGLSAILLENGTDKILMEA